MPASLTPSGIEKRPNLLICFFSSIIEIWNQNARNQFSHLDWRLCFPIVIGLLASTITYFHIPYDQKLLQKFIPELVSIYSMVDSSPQRIGYIIFLFTTIISSLFFIRLPGNFYRDTTNGSIIIGYAVLVSIAISLWTSNLNFLENIILSGTIAAMFLTYYTKITWIAWVFITILMIGAILPGWLHTPTPVSEWMTSFDQHYNLVLYQGRQLAAGHLYSSDTPPYYGMLWSTIIGIVAKKIQTPSFANLVRLVQVGQVLCLALFTLAATLRTRGSDNVHRTIAIVFFSVAVFPWLSTDGMAIWHPNQSGLRFLFVPIAICCAFLTERTSLMRAGLIVGVVSGLAIIANFETGIAVAAGISMAFLVQMREKAWQMRFYSITTALSAFLGVHAIFANIYYYFFSVWPAPNSLTYGFHHLLTCSGGFLGLRLPLRSLVFVMLAHCSYKLIQSIQCLFDKQTKAPDAMTTTIATILLVWLPYYMNRPDDWNLWTFIALYSLLIIPIFTDPAKSKPILFVIMSLIVLPITVRNIPNFLIEPLRSTKWGEVVQPGCAGGLILPPSYCTHIQERANTLRNFASRGSVAWSTSLPVLTDQTANVKGLIWSGNILNIVSTEDDLKKIINKIKREKIAFLLFDDPNDLLIKLHPSEVIFNNRLLYSVRGDYEKPQLVGGWLVAKRNL